MGLGERMKNFPAQLSGGEQQRVAIARARAKNPKLLLCDEPTGALDYVTGKNILKLLQDTCRRTGMTVVIITHNSALTAMADRVISIKSGTIQSVRKNEHVTPLWKRSSGEDMLLKTAFREIKTSLRPVSGHSGHYCAGCGLFLPDCGDPHRYDLHRQSLFEGSGHVR